MSDDKSHRARTLARVSFDTIETWYHMGLINQVEWEAWHAARDMLHPDGNRFDASKWDKETLALAHRIAAAWYEDHMSTYQPLQDRLRLNGASLELVAVLYEILSPDIKWQREFHDYRTALHRQRETLTHKEFGRK